MAGVSKWAYLDAVYTDEGFDPPKEMKVFDPHSGQLEIMEDPARFKVCPCGRRLGKSNMVGHEFIPHALYSKTIANTLLAEGKRMEYWIVGPEYADSEKSFRVFYDKCKRLGIPFDKPGTYYSVQSSDMVVSLWDGAFVLQAKSEARPNSLVGEGLSGVLLDEAAKMKQNTWEQLIRPTLSDFGGWATFTSTPEGKNWFYELYLKAIKRQNPMWSGHRIPAWKNPHVYKEPTVDAHVKQLMRIMAENPSLTSFEIITAEGFIIDSEIADLANTLTVPTFNQEIAAEFTDFVGKVFKEFDAETHSRKLSFNPGWKTVAAVDYGYRNPNVWLLIQIGPWGEINIIDELYQENLAPDEFAYEILRRGLCPDICTEFFPDPALPGDTKMLENIFRRAGKRIRARSHTGGELQNRLNLIRLALRQRINDTELNAPSWAEHPPKPDLMRPRLMIGDNCPNSLREFSEYRYPEKKDEMVETSTKRFELPMKKDDHTPEALGRMLAGMYYDAAHQYGSGTRVSMARFLNGLGKMSAESRGGYGPEPAGIPNTRNPVRRGTWMSGVGS